jgi:hypothetical protein
MRLSNLILGMVLLATIASACVPFFGQPPTAVPSPAAPRAVTSISSPAPTSTGPLSTATPTAASGGVAAPARIQFQPGSTSTTLQGSLGPNGMDSYLLHGSAGQTVAVNVSGASRLLLQISGADGNPLKTFGAGSSNWRGTLPTTQDYLIGITTDDGSPASYALQVNMGSLGTSASPQTKRLQFASGSISTTVQGNLAANGIDVYTLRALAGQTMSVNITSSTLVLLAVSGADGNVLKSSGAGSSNWSGSLPTTQDYILTLSAASGAPTTYTLQITVPPRSP